MNIFPRPPDTWNRACFRVLVGCALALLFAFFAIRSAEEAAGAYRNGYWSIFRKWEEITRAIILCFGFGFLSGSALLLRFSAGQKRVSWYAMVGVCIGVLFLAVYSLGLSAKPR
jgi:hypothetical protein